MPKFKKGRIGIRIDMTPMVDVLFLLLTFFMLVVQFRPPEEFSIVLPSSRSPIKLPESEIAVITVTKEGNYYFGVDQQHLRVQLFGEEARLKPSVRVEPTELSELSRKARMANPKLRFMIQGDKDVEYGPVLDAINALEKALIMRFNLVTDLKRE